MADPQPRHRKGRLRLLLAALGLVLALGGFQVYRTLVAKGIISGFSRYSEDPDLVRKLQQVTLADRDNSSALPGDWPQWRGPRRDGVSLETGLLSSWPKGGPPVVWKVPSGVGYSSLAVAGGRIYTMVQDGSNETVLCLAADSGKDVWRKGYKAEFRGSHGSGPRATPTVDGDRVYTVGATGIFQCRQADTGDLLWQHDLLKEFDARIPQWGISFSPLVEGDLVFTNPGGPGGNSIAAFHKMSGDLAWKKLDDIGGYASPVAATLAGMHQVLFFTGKALVGVTPKDGTLLWRYPWETSFDCNIATPIAVGDYVFISSDYDKGCALLEISAEKAGSLMAKPVYEHNRMRNHFSSSVRSGDHLYGFDDARLVCMALKSGKIQWKESGFKKGSLLIADGRLIVLGEEGRLALAEVSPEAYREISSFQVFRQQCWTVPVVANGRLFVRDENQIICLDLRGG